MSDEYPKMIYREGGSLDRVFPVPCDYKIVDSAADEKLAAKDGWKTAEDFIRHLANKSAKKTPVFESPIEEQKKHPKGYVMPEMVLPDDDIVDTDPAGL